MYFLGLLLFVIHIVAFVAGGANGVLMAVMGPRLATASPDGRQMLFSVADAVSRIGKYSMIALLVTGVLVLWLKWEWVVPNGWFWVKMALVVTMIVFISLNEMNAKAGRAGDAAAARRSQMFGQLTGLAFIGIVISAVLAFN